MDNFFKDLLEQDGFTNPSTATQIKMLARNYVKKAEERETEFVRKEAEFKTREKQYLAEIVSLTNQNAEKDKFISILAHDLRSPLSGFLGLSEELEKGANTMSTEELQSIVGAMHKSAKNLFQFLEDLLEWAKVKTSRFNLNLEKIYLGAIAFKAKMLTSTHAETKGINVEIEIPVDLELKADGRIIETVMRNLIDNAIKFSHKGDKIIISGRFVNETIAEISVSDNGIGMSKEMVGKMFQLNSDIQRPGTDNEKSSGLGLLLCKELVNLHGGEIWAESEEGIGSTFRFTIPLSDDSYQSGQPTELYNKVLNADHEH